MPPEHSLTPGRAEAHTTTHVKGALLRVITSWKPVSQAPSLTLAHVHEMLANSHFTIILPIHMVTLTKLLDTGQTLLTLIL